MRQLRIAVLMVAAGLCWCAVAQESTDVTADGPRVTLRADDMPAREVAAEIQRQTGVQVAVTRNTTKSLTGGLEDRTLEDSVRLLAEGADASWMRAYIIEREPPEAPWNAEQLLARLASARQAWLEGLTDEQRREVFGRLRGEWMPDRPGPAQAQPGASEAGPRERQGMQMPQYPGGGIFRPQGEGTAQGGPAGPGRGPGWAMMEYEDPIRGILLPVRSDAITLRLEDASIAEAISQFTAASGFLVLAPTDLEGSVSLQLADRPVGEALDAIAQAAGAQWRTFYVVAQPRPLTEQELATRRQQMEQRREQMFNRIWSEFWQMSPEDRRQRVERIVDRLNNIPPERRERAQRFIGRIMPRVMDYSATLSADRRMEIKPILQAMARIAQ